MKREGKTFISYAVWWIRQCILQALAEQSRTIRLPLNKIGSISKINKAMSKLEQRHERMPSAEEIANEVDVSVDNVKSCLKASSRSVSMDASFREGESSNLYDVVSSHKSPNPEKGLIQDSLRTHISMVLKRLPDKEATVLKMYFGLNTQQPMSLSEIGDHFEITRERVRQMKEKAIKKLRIKDSKEVLQTYLD